MSFWVVNNYFVKLLFVLVLFSCENRFSKYAVPKIDELKTYDQSKVNAYIRENMKQFPNNIDFIIYKLRILKDRDWPIGSNSEINTALLIDSLNTSVLELAADLYVNRKEYDEALGFAAKAEKLGANSAIFYQLKSQIYNGKGQYDRAIDYINKAILINRSDYKSYYDKGKIYLSFGDTISGLKFMNTGLAHYKNNHEALYEVSDIYEKIGHYTESEKLINEAIYFAPKNEKLRIKQSEIYNNQGKKIEAKEVLKTYFHEDSTSLESAMNLGNIYFELLDFDSAILVLDQINSYDSLNLGALLLKAKSYDMKGFYNNSISNYEQVLSVDSSYQDAKLEWEKVSRKRAYLQKLKKEREAVPSFDFIIPTKKKTL
ncbi:MAG: hypothetical protein NWS46_08835 [Cyclobacteriaceae bacterium]|jgi:tetratricopeptide (TPR) repeat protein|nr:hypothetical protein [Cyclobacteriaceae bacterium]